MTVADALTELKRIDKAIQRRCQSIRRYCSKRKSSKDEIENQKAYVTAKIQSAEDLIRRYQDIKLTINESNLVTLITFRNRTFSVAEAILFKQWTHAQQTVLLSSFDTTTATTQIRDFQRTIVQGAINPEAMEKLDLVPELLYNEKKIESLKEQNLDMYSYVDALIEKSNHHTFIDFKIMPEGFESEE